MHQTKRLTIIITAVVVGFFIFLGIITLRPSELITDKDEEELIPKKRPTLNDSAKITTATIIQTPDTTGK